MRTIQEGRGFALLFPDKEKEKKRIRFSTIIPAVLLVFVMVMQCFTVNAYASVYCKYCGSAYAWSNDLTYLYHVQLYDGGCPAATLYEEEESGQITVSLSSMTSAMREAYYNADESVLLELYDGFTLTRISSYSSSDFNETYEDDTVSASDENLGNYNSNATTTSEGSDEIFIAGGIIDTVFGTETSSDADTLMEPLTILESSCQYIVDTMDTITGLSLYRTLQIIGMCLMTVYFLLEMGTKNVQKEFGKPTLEMYAEPLGRFFISMVVLVNVWALLKLFLFLAQYGYYQVESLGTISSVLSGSASGSLQKTIGTAAGYDFENSSWRVDLWNGIVGLGLAITFLVPWILTLAAKVAAIWVIFSRTVNIVVMGTLAPVAMSDLYSQKPITQTRAFDYIRKYAGVAFQCITIPLVFYVVNLIAGDYIKGLIDLIDSSGTIRTFGAIALYVSILKMVQVGAIFASARTAKEIFGVA